MVCLCPPKINLLPLKASLHLSSWRSPGACVTSRECVGLTWRGGHECLSQGKGGAGGHPQSHSLIKSSGEEERKALMR